MIKIGSAYYGVRAPKCSTLGCMRSATRVGFDRLMNRAMVCAEHDRTPVKAAS